jgi:hypothetical protein
MSWGEVAAFVGAAATFLVAFLGTLVGALRYVLDRHDNHRNALDDKIANVTKEVYDLKAMLPMRYVMREDWIRFSATIEGKIDAMREEFRGSLEKLSEKLN